MNNRYKLQPTPNSSKNLAENKSVTTHTNTTEPIVQ